MIQKRVQHALDLRGWSRRDLSEKTGTSYRTVLNRMKDGATVPAEWLADVAELLNVSPGWLLSGEGSPRVAGESAEADAFQIIAEIVDRVRGTISPLGAEDLARRVQHLQEVAESSGVTNNK